MSSQITSKPHAVCIPFPAQGHINPMLKLAKILHRKGFHITFVNTEYNHRRLIKSQGPKSVNGLHDFQLKTIPDGLPFTEDIDVTQEAAAICESTSKNCLVPFRDMVCNINNQSDLPPVSCIVSDGLMSFTLDVAEELGIPEVLFWTTSACGFMGYLQFPHLIQQGLTPLKDVSYATNGYLDKPVDWIPGVNGLCLRDLPSFIQTTDPDDIVFNFALQQVERVPKASAIVLNTFEELEQETLDAITPVLPPVYTIGPLHLLANQFSDKRLDDIRSNLWKEEAECLQWLEAKEPRSVVYVNFGSVNVMTPQQMTEFGWGLASSNYAFLWVVRPDLVSGEGAVLTSEFVEKTKDRGQIVSWCPQEQVLNHPSIAGFLTHNGWNSTLECMCSGVPMICWPGFAEQQMNRRYSCVDWSVGMELDSNVERNKVEFVLRVLMEAKEGKDLKMNAMKWKKRAEEAASIGGSSYENIDKLVREILITS